jgi:hypothetical protein
MWFIGRWGLKDSPRDASAKRGKVKGTNLEYRLWRLHVPSIEARFGKSWVGCVGLEDRAKRIDGKNMGVGCTATGWWVRRWAASPCWCPIMAALPDGMTRSIGG